MINLDSQNSQSGLGADLTPLIDIIFIVMVFLMFSLNAKVHSLEFQLPTSGSSALHSVDKKPHLVIGIESQGWYLDQQFYDTWQDFEQQLLIHLNSTPDQQISVAADQNLSLQKFMQVLALLRENDITDTQILMEQNL